MNPLNFNLRNIAPDLMSLLKIEAKKQNESVNSLILSILGKNFGMIHKTRKNKFHDLDYLAGTWDDEDEKNFKTNITSLEKIDEELWK